MSLNKVATSMKSPAEGSCQPGCRLNCEVERTDREAKRNNHCIRGSIAAIGDACLCTPQRLRVECKEIIARQVLGLIVLCRLDKAETSLLQRWHMERSLIGQTRWSRLDQVFDLILSHSLTRECGASSFGSGSRLNLHEECATQTTSSTISTSGS
jgi:hypothetical protein